MRQEITIQDVIVFQKEADKWFKLHLRAPKHQETQKLWNLVELQFDWMLDQVTRISNIKKEYRTPLWWVPIGKDSMKQG
jgi:hypothetical protein